MFVGDGYSIPSTNETNFGIDDPLKRHNINTLNNTDPYTQGMLSMIPDGELYTARLGNQINGSETEMLRYTYIVDDNSGFLYYKYAIVFLPIIIIIIIIMVFPNLVR